jgi:hypothetical protein
VGIAMRSVFDLKAFQRSLYLGVTPLDQETLIMTSGDLPAQAKVNSSGERTERSALGLVLWPPSFRKSATKTFW